MYIAPSQATRDVEELLKLSRQKLVPPYMFSGGNLLLNSMQANDVFWNQCYLYDKKVHEYIDASTVAKLDISEILDLVGSYIPSMRFDEKSLSFTLHCNKPESRRWFDIFSKAYKPIVLSEISSI